MKVVNNIADRYIIKKAKFVARMKDALSSFIISR